MKQIGVSILEVFSLVFFASTIQAQDQSAESSDVIVENSWWEWYECIYCPSTGIICTSGTLHALMKILLTGTYTIHFV